MRGDGQLWTEAHRARHQPRLKGLVGTCAVEEIARWLGRADPPRSGRATPVRRVVGAIAWRLRVGGPWRSLPRGWPPWRTVYGWFRRWLELGLFEALREVARRRRRKGGRRRGATLYQRPELLTRHRVRSLVAPDAVDRRCSRSAELAITHISGQRRGG